MHLDDYLERLGHHESDELAIQVSAYIDNDFDVANLVEEAEMKWQAAMEQVTTIFVLLSSRASLIVRYELEKRLRSVYFYPDPNFLPSNLPPQVAHLEKELERVSERLRETEAEAQKPSWHRGIAIRKVFAHLESFCAFGKFLRICKVFARNP